MRLSFEQIKSITRGAVDIRREEGSIAFFKCTKSQSDAWYALNDTLGMRSLTTTGIRLDFHTTSRSIAFRASQGNKFELLVNGLLYKQLRPNESGVTEAVTVLDDSMAKRENGMLRVTLSMPSHTIGRLDYIELDDGAEISPHEYDRKILFIGDSITQGHASKFDTLSYAWQTTLEFNADSVINGIGGAFYHIPTFDRPDFEPDAVILAYGTNDATRYRNNYGEMHRHVTTYMDLVSEAYPGAKIIVISPVFRADESFMPLEEWFTEKRKMIENEAEKRGFYVICGLDIMPHLPDCFSDKYLHPNDLGFSLYASNLCRRLKEIL